VNQTRFCGSSLLWSWAKIRSAHFGALLARQFRLWVRKPKLKYSLPVWFLGIGLLGFGSFLLIESPWAVLQGPDVDIVFIGAALYFFGLGLPLGFWVSWRSRRSPINRWIHFDNLLNLSSLGVIFWIAFDSYDLHDARPYLLFVAANHWLFQFVRFLEAALSSSRLQTEEKDRMRSAIPFPAASQLHHDIEAAELRVFLMGALGLSLIIYVATSSFALDHLGKMMLLSLPLLGLPFHQGLASKILRRSLFHRVYLPRFQHFGQIARIRHLRSHHLGVLASSDLSFSDWWLDPSSVWTESEIQELVASMSRDVAHPICEALHRQFEGSDSKVRISDLRSIPYLGLQVSFRNKEGQLLHVCLGSLNWFQAELHDLSPEGERINSEWLDRQLRTCFLSINRRIVAGFALSTSARKDSDLLFETLRFQRRSLCLLSSSNGAAIQVDEKDFLEVARNLLPVERETQLQHWAERAKEFIELRSTWDPPPSDSAYPIIFGRRSDQVAYDKSICIMGDSLSACSWLFQEAETWSKQNRLAYVLPLIFTAVGATLLLTPGFVTYPAIAGLSYLVWQIQQVKI
jgi:hypothetical protein